MNDTVIERIQDSKVLGLTISPDLTWGVHVDNTSKKAGKGVYMLYKLKRAGVIITAKYVKYRFQCHQTSF